MINTVEDARRFVAVAKFPPLGERSWGPNRAMMLGDFADQKAYLRDANERTVTLAMIETRVPRWATSMRSRQRRASTCCLSAHPICRSR